MNGKNDAIDIIENETNQEAPFKMGTNIPIE